MRNSVHVRRVVKRDDEPATDLLPVLLEVGGIAALEDDGLTHLTVGGRGRRQHGAAALNRPVHGGAERQLLPDRRPCPMLERFRPDLMKSIALQGVAQKVTGPHLVRGARLPRADIVGEYLQVLEGFGARLDLLDELALGRVSGRWLHPVILPTSSQAPLSHERVMAALTRATASISAKPGSICRPSAPTGFSPVRRW